MLSLDRATDLLKKCEYNIGRLFLCDTHPEYDYAMFDVVVSLNHLFEWFLKDKTIPEQERLKCIKEFNPFQSPYDVSSDFKKLYKKLDLFPKTNEPQLNIRLLCNKAKHFKKTQIETQGKNILSTAGNMYAGNVNSVAAYFERYKYSVDINGTTEDLQELMEKLINQWSEFCGQ